MTQHLRRPPPRPALATGQPPVTVDPRAAALDYLATREAGTLVGGAMPAPFLAIPTGERTAAVPILCGPAHAKTFVADHRDLLGLPGGLWLQVWQPRQTLLVIDLAHRSHQTLRVLGDFGPVDTTALDIGPTLEDRVGLVDWDTTPTAAHATFRFGMDHSGNLTLTPDRFPDPQDPT